MSDAATQLCRLLRVLPHLADERSHPLANVARLADADVRTVLADLRLLAERLEDPGGFVEGVQVYLEAERVEVRSVHFLRPMTLTRAELAALELGLAVLAHERAPDEQATFAGARRRLRQILDRLPADWAPVQDIPAAVALGAPPPDFAAIRQAILARRALRLTYQKAADLAPAERVVRPVTLIPGMGRWYLATIGDGADDVRFFRLDRVLRVEPTAERFTVPEGLDVSRFVQEGIVFGGAEPARMLVVRYGPRVARWIAERERVPLAADGSVTVERPLADVDWAVRHALQYGGEAEVLAPPEVRAALVARLRTAAP